MENSRKMVVMPFGGNDHRVTPQSEVKPPDTNLEPKKKRKSSKERSTEKLRNTLEMILKIAKIDGYDQHGRLHLNGRIVENSDISTLIQHSLMPGRVLIGEREFIDLLHEARVNPTLIINDNMRAKLIQLGSRGPKHLETKEDIKDMEHQQIPSRAMQTITPIQEFPESIVKQSSKRRREDDDEEPAPTKKTRPIWEIPD